MYGCAQIVKGSVKMALIGGVEEANEMLFSVLDRVGALSRTAARPFAADRDGMTIGEGGAVLVAGGESREPYGSLSGFGIARDTTASVSDWGTDAGAVIAAMRAAIDDAELDPSDIDAIYASANGSIRGDALEAAALRAFLPDRPVVTTKEVFGEYAAGGALQLVAALLDPRYRNILVNSISAGGGIVCAIVSRS
jgi:3-oxoacyl-(acyl-carrier-protein) synthase